MLVSIASLRRYFFFFAFCSALLSHGAAFGLSVDHVRLGVHPDRTRLVIDLSQASSFRVFLASAPNRLIIDLPDFAWRAGPWKPAPGSGITALRYGTEMPGITRITMDLAKPVSIQSAFPLPSDGEKPHRLVVDFRGASELQFQKELNRVYGSLGGTMPKPGSSQNSLSPDVPGLPPPKPAYRPMVIIDPGHGGADAGATGSSHILEKNVTLALARALRDQLVNSGQYRVMLTRDSDIFIKLRDRVAFAHRNKGDLFISLHADSIDKPRVRGASIYTLSDKASDEQTAALADRENKADIIGGIDLSGADEEVANILVDLTMRDTMNQSRFFAGKLAGIFTRDSLKLLDKPNRSAGFAVLKSPDIPSVLVEAGFMSNDSEAQLLNSDGHRRKIAAALKKSIDAYFEQVRKNQRN